jgi:hypothetical protein
MARRSMAVVDGRQARRRCRQGSSAYLPATSEAGSGHEPRRPDTVHCVLAQRRRTGRCVRDPARGLAGSARGRCTRTAAPAGLRTESPACWGRAVSCRAMTTEIKSWEIVDGRLVPVDKRLADYGRREALDLESWLESDPSIIRPGLKIIGRQVLTRSGPLDLLAIDRTGSVVVIELKRDRLPREALAQAIDYAADIATWSLDKLGEVCAAIAERPWRACSVTRSQISTSRVSPSTALSASRWSDSRLSQLLNG